MKVTIIATQKISYNQTVELDKEYLESLIGDLQSRNFIECDDLCLNTSEIFDAEDVDVDDITIKDENDNILFGE